MFTVSTTRRPVGLTCIASLQMKAYEIQEIRLYCNGPAQEEFKDCMEGLGEEQVPAVSAGKEKNNFSKSRCKNSLFNFKSILTLKGLAFQILVRPREGMESASLWNFVI